MSIVAKDARGVVVEGTVVEIGEGICLIGTEEERRREGLGRLDPVDLAAALVAEGVKAGTRVSIVCSRIS